MDALRQQLEAAQRDLAAKQTELETLQGQFDIFQESSKEIEHELEKELELSEERNSASQREVARIKEVLEQAQAKFTVANDEVLRLTQRLETLLAALKSLETSKVSLETDKDQLAEKVRALEASEEHLKHQLEVLTEKTILQQHEIDDMKTAHQEATQRLRDQISDLEVDLMATKMAAHGETHPPVPPSAPPSEATPPAAPVEAVTARSDALARDLEALRAQYEELAAQHDAVRASAADTHMQVERRSQEAADMEVRSTAALANLRLERDQLKDELEKTKAAMEQVMSQTGDKPGTVAGDIVSTGDLELLKRQLAESQQQREAAETASTEVRAELNGKLEQVSIMEARLKAELAAAKLDQEQLKTELAGVRQHMESIRPDDASVRELENLRRDCEGLRSQLEGSRALSEAKERITRELEEQVASLRSALSSAQQERVQVQKDLDEAKSVSTQGAQSHIEEKDALARELQTLRSTYDELQLQHDAAQAMAEESELQLQDDIKRLQEHQARLTSELASVNESRSHLEKEVDDVNRLLREAKEKLQAAEVEAGSLRIERDEALELATDGTDKLEEITMVLAEHKARIADQEATIQELMAKAAERENTAPTAIGSSDREHELELRIADLETRVRETRRQSLVAQRNLRYQASLDSAGGAQQDGSLLGVEDVIRSGDEAAMAGKLRVMTEKLQRQRNLNSMLLERMQSTQNKIQVYCRVRPLTDGEVSSTAPVVIEPLSDLEVGFLDRRRGDWRAFAFDRVWGPDQTQEEAFLDVEPLALNVLKGSNACIMAYGQTGSGKTFTMQGDDGGDGANWGLSYRIIQKVFDGLQRHKRRTNEQREDADGPPEPTYSVTVSMVEVYNEDIRDLLRPDASTAQGREDWRDGNVTALGGGSIPSLEIRRDADGIMQIPGMVEEEITSAEEGLAAIARGNENRTTAATSIHEYSSRSHSVLMLTVTSTVSPPDTADVGTPEQTLSGRLMLVDLAGSERVKRSAVTGAELKEAQHINKSLSALGDIMEALSKKTPHVPFRNAALTRLLQDCFSGSSCALMIFTVCPLEETADESLCTLQFATRARSITLSHMASAVKAKNAEAKLKAVQAELRAVASKKMQAEDALVAARKEQVTSQKKMVATVDSRTRHVEELKRVADDQIASFKGANRDLVTKLAAEKAAKERVFAELEDLQRQARKLRSALDAKGTALSDVRQALAAKEAEITSLRKTLREQSHDISSISGPSQYLPAPLSARSRVLHEQRSSACETDGGEGAFVGDVTGAGEHGAVPTKDTVSRAQQPVRRLQQPSVRVAASTTASSGGTQARASRVPRLNFASHPSTSTIGTTALSSSRTIGHRSTVATDDGHHGAMTARSLGTSSSTVRGLAAGYADTLSSAPQQPSVHRGVPSCAYKSTVASQGNRFRPVKQTLSTTEPVGGGADAVLRGSASAQSIGHSRSQEAKPSQRQR